MSRRTRKDRGSTNPVWRSEGGTTEWLSSRCVAPVWKSFWKLKKPVDSQ